MTRTAPKAFSSFENRPADHGELRVRFNGVFGPSNEWLEVDTLGCWGKRILRNADGSKHLDDGGFEVHETVRGTFELSYLTFPSFPGDAEDGRDHNLVTTGEQGDAFDPHAVSHHEQAWAPGQDTQHLDRTKRGTVMHLGDATKIACMLCDNHDIVCKHLDGMTDGRREYGKVAELAMGYTGEKSWVEEQFSTGDLYLDFARYIKMNPTTGRTVKRSPFLMHGDTPNGGRHIYYYYYEETAEMDERILRTIETKKSFVDSIVNSNYSAIEERILAYHSYKVRDAKIIKDALERGAKVNEIHDEVQITEPGNGMVRTRGA